MHVKYAPWDLDFRLLDADIVKNLFTGIDQRLWVHGSVPLFGLLGANTRGFNNIIFGEACCPAVPTCSLRPQCPLLLVLHISVKV